MSTSFFLCSVISEISYKCRIWDIKLEVLRLQCSVAAANW